MWNPVDQHNSSAKRSWKVVRGSELVTTDAVLIEVLNAFSSFKRPWREIIAQSIEIVLSETRISVVRLSSELFHESLLLYKSRRDKTYSFTDCISMIVMRQERIKDVLSSDHHFEQEGFTLLMKA